MRPRMLKAALDVLADMENTRGTYTERMVGRFDGEHPKGEFFVSTAAVGDGRQAFETAVVHPDYNGGRHVIVEAYDTRGEAEVGHARWVDRMTSEPLPAGLVDCGNSELERAAREEFGDDWQTRYPRRET